MLKETQLLFQHVLKLSGIWASMFLRYKYVWTAFQRLLSSSSPQATLVDVQGPFKETLLQEVQQLTVDSKEFYDVYNAEGLTLLGLRLIHNAVDNGCL